MLNKIICLLKNIPFVDSVYDVQKLTSRLGQLKISMPKKILKMYLRGWEGIAVPVLFFYHNYEFMPL